MNILITSNKGFEREIFFPVHIMEAIKKLGNVTLNDTEIPFSEDDLANIIQDIDICITHWSCPKFSEKVLENAGRLKMIAHAAGSVAYLITDPVYERGIKVCSANSVMAEYVAEGALAYILAGLRLIPQHNNDMKNGKSWERKLVENRSLLREKVGLVGLGTVGMYLLELLKPFGVKIKLYDPYVSQTTLEAYPNVQQCSLDETLSWGNIISIHASMTPETWHLIDKDKLKLIKDNALFINTARGAIIDEAALINELQIGRFSAVLDVFEKEPFDPNSALRNLENVILMPHMAGATAKEEMTQAMIEEIERFIKHEPLKYEIPFNKYKLMTR